jgi:hypothetical protein
MRLSEEVARAYGHCTFLRSENVRQIYKQRAIWQGEVGVFLVETSGHKVECYAWSNEDLLGATVPPAVMLSTVAVDSADAAVHAYVLSLCHELTA